MMKPGDRLRAVARMTNRTTCAVRLTIDSGWNALLRRAFDSWAPTYSETARAKLARRGYAYEELADEVWRGLGQPDRGVIVELGCGTGLVGSNLPCGPGIALVGVDISSGMLSIATNGKYRALIQADAASLPLGTATADGVFSTFMLHSARDRARVLSEVRRVLRPGGRAVLVDLCPDNETHAWSHLTTLIHSLLYERGAPSHYYPATRLAEDLRRAGLVLRSQRLIGERRSYAHLLVEFLAPQGDLFDRTREPMP